MILSSFFAQIMMLIIGIGIVLTYVQPTFEGIGVTQTTIAQYQEEQTKVNEVNAKLSSLVSQLNNITTSDMRSLMTYMPDTIDHVSVSRDIYKISEISGVLLEGITYEGEIQNTSVPEDGNITEAQPYGFSTSVSGSYDQVKNFLQLLEQNNYPLEIQEMTMGSTEIGLINATMVIITYSHTKNI